MAFLSRAGNLFKQATSSKPALYQAFRCMSTSKLFIGGLAWGTDDNSLRNAFANYGEVVEARVIQDRETGRSRGFGFVTFQSTEEAAAAMSGMDGKEIDGRAVRVNYANERPSYRGGFGGGSGFGGGGGGGGGYVGGGYGAGGYGGGGNYDGGNYGGDRGRYGGGGNYGGDRDGYGGGGYGGGEYRGGGQGGNYGVTESGGNYGDLGSGNTTFSGNSAGGYSGNTGGDFSLGGASTGSDDSLDNFDSKEDQYDDKDDGLNDDFKLEDNEEQEPDDFANKRS